MSKDDLMCTIYGCDDCKECTDDSLSVDGQCNSNGFNGQQCAGMPDGGYK
jgi:hypothetical protein